jgi:hypothetical protein
MFIYVPSHFKRTAARQRVAQIMLFNSFDDRERPVALIDGGL